ncbi:hypothetical protein Ddye_003558 [Dipteronia dyeriana]|uniref:DUF4283 domain-containing protein n=1 Tax=Dipteronia dyeriana TaxID=168575 RepID=A0AAD9XSI2_9ROSI|nr:hypothetical protein Ddye_003558 [Dipteronia dyeriana]
MSHLMLSGQLTLLMWQHLRCGSSSGGVHLINGLDLKTLCATMSLKELEGPVRKLEGDLKIDGERKLSLCLVGKVMANKLIHRDVFWRVLLRIWKLRKSIYVEVVSDNIFTYHFQDTEDRRRVLTGRPWSFDNFLIVLVEPNGKSDILHMPFDRAAFWIQIHNVPLLCITKRIWQFLGNLIGDVVEIDEGASGDCDDFEAEELLFGAWLKDNVPIIRPMKQETTVSLQCRLSQERDSRGDRRKVVDITHKSPFAGSNLVVPVPAEDWTLDMVRRESDMEGALSFVGKASDCDSNDFKFGRSLGVGHEVGFSVQISDETEISHLDFWRSDHRPLLVEVSNSRRCHERDRFNRRFHFEAYWAEDEGSQLLIERNYKISPLSGACKLKTNWINSLSKRNDYGNKGQKRIGTRMVTGRQGAGIIIRNHLRVVRFAMGENFVPAVIESDVKAVVDMINMGVAPTADVGTIGGDILCLIYGKPILFLLFLERPIRLHMVLRSLRCLLQMGLV